MDLLIRFEEPSDQPGIFALNQLAFGRPDEARLVDALRQAGVLTHSVVALHQGWVIGHIGFSPVLLHEPSGATACLGLAPMAVHPDFQRQGVGREMYVHWLHHADFDAYPLLFVLGHPTYYPQLGFERAAPYHLTWDQGDYPEAFMVQELRLGGLLHRRGKVSFHQLFNGID